jgi:hypothetical protein
MADDNKEVSKEAPRYVLTEPAYIDDRLYAAEQEVTFEGIPGYHMTPINDAAKAMKKKHNKEYLDPILAMTSVGGKE